MQKITILTSFFVERYKSTGYFINIKSIFEKSGQIKKKSTKVIYIIWLILWNITVTLWLCVFSLQNMLIMLKLYWSEILIKSNNFYIQLLNFRHCDSKIENNVCKTSCQSHYIEVAQGDIFMEQKMWIGGGQLPKNRCEIL